MSRGGRTWTPAQLARERAEFFDTRVAGRQEIWQALRAALELMWEADTVARDGRVRQQQQQQQEDQGEVVVDGGAHTTTTTTTTTTDHHHSGEEDRAAALATAQTILSAAEITLPTGDLVNGAYDAFGNYYAFPEHIVSDPINISLTEEAAGDEVCGDVKGDFTAGEEETAEEEEEDDEEAVRRREEKGKAVVDMRDQVPLRARLSEGDRDVTLSIGRGESARSVSRRIAEEALVGFTFTPPFQVGTFAYKSPSLQLPATKKIRLAYMGKILKESSSLLSQGWKQGHVVNALVFSR